MLQWQWHKTTEVEVFRMPSEYVADSHMLSICVGFRLLLLLLLQSAWNGLLLLAVPAGWFCHRWESAEEGVVD